MKILQSKLNDFISDRFFLLSEELKSNTPETTIEAGKVDYCQKLYLLLKSIFAVSDQLNDIIIFVTLLIKMKFGFAGVFLAADLLPGRVEL